MLPFLTTRICRLQEESSANQETKKLEVQAQIEAERRATEQYRVCPDLVKGCSHAFIPTASPGSKTYHIQALAQIPFYPKRHCCGQKND